MHAARRPGWFCRAGVFVCVVCAPAWASPADYNYLDAAWLKSSPDDAAVADSDGYRLKVSAPLDQNNFLRASYGRLEDDDGAKSSHTSVGLGSYTTLSPGTDFYGLLSYQDIDYKSAAGDKGGALELGLRFIAGQRTQLDLGVAYSKLERAGDEVQWLAEGLLHITPGFALSAQYRLGEADSRYAVGLRLFQK